MNPHDDFAFRKGKTLAFLTTAQEAIKNALMHSDEELCPETQLTDVADQLRTIQHQIARTAADSPATIETAHVRGYGIRGTPPEVQG